MQVKLRANYSILEIVRKYQNVFAKASFQQSWTICKIVVISYKPVKRRVLQFLLEAFVASKSSGLGAPNCFPFTRRSRSPPRSALRMKRDPSGFNSPERPM